MYKNTSPFLGPTPKVVHLVGIGGIGISALAQWFLTQKWAVSGSDIFPNETTRSLQKLGIKVKFGHKKGNIPRDCILVICTRAVRPQNVELREARRRKISTLSYPEAVGRLTESYKTVAIAGAHGKSTTTAFTALILTKAGFDPTVIIGTKLKEFGGRPAGRNFRKGKSSYLVLEADEYNGAFLNYSPFYTIVTNIDKEHMDFYKNLKNVKKSFLEFFLRTENGGALILNRDSKILFSLKPAIEKIAHRRGLKVSWYSVKNPESAKVREIIRVAGKHNVSNALAAFHLSKILKIPERVALRAIAGYRGSWRRMEYRGEFHLPSLVSHLSVYDDYAHHPTEIKATLQAFREKFPKRKIVCVFQPHQAERLKLLFKEFQTAFDEADVTLILPVYRVAGRDKVDLRFTSEKLVQTIQKKRPKKLIFYLKSPNDIKKALSALLSSNPPALSPVIVMMGAGDIARYTDSLLKN